MNNIFKLLFVLIFSIPLSLKGQDIYQGNVINRKNEYRNTNELKNYKTTYQLFLFEKNEYKLLVQTYVYNFFKGRKNIDCFTIKGKWALKNNILSLSSDGFNNITNYKLINKKLYLLDENNKIIKSHKLKKTVKSNQICDTSESFTGS